MAFDPDAYLAGSTTAPKAAGGFDPDAYLSGKPTASEGIPGERSVGGFLGNVVKSGGKMLGGIYEAVTHPLDTATAIADIGAGALQKALPESVVNFINKFDTNPEAAQRAVKVAEAVGGEYKNRYGSIDAIKNTLYTDPVGAAADLSMLLSGGGSVLTKAGEVGKAAQVARAGEVASKAGAAINPMRAIPLETAGKVVGKATGFVSNALAPKTAAVIEATEGRAPEIVNALRTYESATPGYAPTAAEAVADLNLTKLPALQREVTPFAASEYYQRAQQQNAALVNPLQVAESIPTAKALRSKETAPMYEAATAAGKTADVESVARFLDKTLADNPGNPALQSELNAVRSSLFERVDGKDVLRTDAQQIASTLDGVKAALAKEDNKFIQGQLTKVKDMLAESIPGYTEAQKKFAAMSKPINQMEVADFLKGKMTNALRGEEKLSPTAFANALENAPGTIKRATGMPRFENLSDVLNPEQIKVIEGIRTDLAKRAAAEEQAIAGSRGGKAIPAAALPTAPHFLSKVTTLVNTIVNKMQGKIDKKIAMELAVELLNPETAATMIEKAARKEAGRKRAGRMAREVGGEVKNLLRSQPVLGAGQVQNALVQ